MLVLFDMDGLLFDTEPLWGDAMKKICDHYHLPLDQKIFRYTTGLRIDEVTLFWKEHLEWPNHLDAHQLANEIVDEIISLAKRKGSILPGIERILIDLEKENIPTAVVTSSPKRMVNELVDHFNVSSYFNNIFSAESVPYGKPHPAVYQLALEAFKISPFQTIALEDSVNGMIAAKAAKINTIVIPEKGSLNKKEFGIADKVVANAEELTVDDFHQLLLPSLFKKET